MESKNIIKQIEADMVEFSGLADKWVASNDISAAAKSRSYAKRLMKSLKRYVSTSMADVENLPEPTPVVFAPVVEEIIEEEELTEED